MTPPSAPTIAPVVPGVVEIGSTIVITPGVGGGIPSLFVEYLDGVASGRAVVATGGAVNYTVQGTDVPLVSITFRALNGGGESVDSNALTETVSLDALLPATLAPGAVAAYNGARGLMHFAPGPGNVANAVASATSFNGTPGVASVGSTVLSSPVDLSSLSTLRVVLAAQDANALASIIFEYTANSAITNGGFSAITNVGAQNLYCVLTNGGQGIRTALETLSQPCVLSIGYDFALAGGIAFVRVNGVSLPLTAAGNACTPGTFANSILNLFARTGLVSPWTGTLGVVDWLKGPAVEDANLEAVEQWAIYQSSPAWWLAPRVMHCGDSITVGSTGGSPQPAIGGSRPLCFSLTAAAGVTCTPVGPYNDFGLHRGVGGEQGRNVLAAPAAFIAELQTYQPNIVILRWGMNDMISGAATGLQTLDTFTGLTALVRQSLPFARCIWDRVIVPFDFAPAFTAQYNAFNAGGPAAAAASAAVWSPFAAPDTWESIPPGHPGGVHPLNGANGYDLLAQAEANAILAVCAAAAERKRLP